MTEGLDAESIPGFAVASDLTQKALKKAVKHVIFQPRQTLIQQKEPARNFYLLLSGDVEFLISVTKNGAEFNTGILSGDGLPVGWSGFREPYRYQATVRAMTEARCLCWPQSELRRLINDDSKFAVAFLSEVLQYSRDLLHTTRDEYLQSALENERLSLAPRSVPVQLPTPEDVHTVLNKALLLDGFSDKFKEEVTTRGIAEYYLKGDELYEQGEESDGVSFLISGRVSLWVDSDIQNVFFRHLDHPGQVLSWGNPASPDYHAFTVKAESSLMVWHIDSVAIVDIVRKFPEEAQVFINRLLWLIGNHLRSLRILTLSNRTDSEAYTVQSLIDQCSASLTTSSRIHKVPVLLEHQVTVIDAFKELEYLKLSGKGMEKSLASLVSDVLMPLKSEAQFINKLSEIYDYVVNSKQSKSSQALRTQCAKKFYDAFKKVPHVISGEENLPDESGNIFILNHLICAPYYQLPNGFEFSLDSHFVSGMIAYPKYGSGGVRVVRKSRGVEFGHQLYYDKLGHIYVYTKESDGFSNETEMKELNKSAFFTVGTHLLENGENIILCPEGTSRLFADSPGEFKPGAFMLARAGTVEKKIVPIAVANFQDRVKDSVWSVVVKPPILLSDHADPNDSNSLRHFLKEYRRTYREYVLEAAELARDQAS